MNEPCLIYFNKKNFVPSSCIKKVENHFRIPGKKSTTFELSQCLTYPCYSFIFLRYKNLDALFFFFDPHVTFDRFV